MTMTNQSIFDECVRHLAQQGGPAVNANCSFCYRTPDGRKCPVGCLIPDDEYDPEMEGFPVATLVREYPNLKLEPFVSILIDLQLVHDEMAGMDGEWLGTDVLAHNLTRVAHQYGLSSEAVRQCFPEYEEGER